MENTYELCNYRKRNDKKKIIDRHRETSNQIYRDSEMSKLRNRQTERKKKYNDTKEKIKTTTRYSEQNW